MPNDNRTSLTVVHIIESSGGSADFVLDIIKYQPQNKHIVIYSDRTFEHRLDAVVKNVKATFIYWKNIQREIRPLQDLGAFFSLYKIMSKLKPDAVHLHSSKAGFIGRIVCFLLRMDNCIYTPNGLAYLRMDVPAYKRALYVMLEKMVASLTGLVVCCSKSEAQAMEKYAIKCIYINNGTEIFQVPPDPTSPEKQLTIGTTGRVTIQKNPQLFNDIALTFLEEQHVRFLWIGGGDLDQELNAENVSVTGWTDRKGVIERLKEVDVYLSTALWEGLPFAVLEAMNKSKPLLLSNCVGNVDLVENGFNGFSFGNASEAHEKIRLLMANPKLIQEMGANSKIKVAKEFDVRVMADKYHDVYVSVKGKYGGK